MDITFITGEILNHSRGHPDHGSHITIPGILPQRRLDAIMRIAGPDYWMTNPGITPKGARKEFIDPEQIPWTDWLMPGTRFKLLYCNLVTGSFTVILQVDAGSVAPPHWHIGNVQAYIIDGGFYYEEDDKGETGMYTCEVAGAVHSPTSPQGTTMLAMVDGPIAGYAPEGELGAIADARLHYYIAAANDAVGHTQLVDYATDPSVGMHSLVPEAAK